MRIMTQTNLDCVEINPDSAVKTSIIWLHGLGADGHDFESIVPELGLAKDSAVRFVFPHAPVRPVTLNGGMPMRAWYDIISLDKEGRADKPGIEASAQLVQNFIDREQQRGISHDNIFLAGFSQGGAMALYCGLLQPQSLAGIIALSAYVPLEHDVREQRHPANQQTPLFLAGGDFDPIVQPQWTRKTAEALKALDYQVSWHNYPIEHSVCMEEIQELGRWLNGLLN